MINHEKILDLLHSPDEKNIALGIALAKSHGDKNIEKDYLELYQYFFDARVTSIEPKHIAQLNNPGSYLELEGTFGMKIPKSIRRLVRLESLNLSDKDLTALPKEIGQLKQLKLLELRNNRLKTLPKSIGKLSNLEALILPNNDIRHLPSSLKQLQSLTFLDLTDNSFVAHSDYLKHRIRHWLPHAHCQLLEYDMIEPRYDIPPMLYKNKPAYFTRSSSAHFCWLLKHLPSRLKALWEAGNFFEYFENISKKRKRLSDTLINEVTSTGLEAIVIASGLVRAIPVNEMTISERAEYRTNTQKEFKVDQLLEDQTFQTIRDKTDFDFNKCNDNVIIKTRLFSTSL